MLASSPPDILFEIMYVPKMFCSNIILYSKAEILNKESLFQIISEIQTNMFVLHLIGFFFFLGYICKRASHDMHYMDEFFAD